MASEVAVAKAVEDNAKAISALTKNFDGLVDKLSRTKDKSHPAASEVFGLPSARGGENIMASRGFSFQKMLGVITGAIAPDDAKIELDVHNRLHNCYTKSMGPGTGYNYSGGARPGERAFMAPLATEYMEETHVPNNFRHEMKCLVNAGVQGADHDEMKWLKQRHYKSMGYNVKTMSWLNELSGGALVAPPEMGELIELLRNKEALVNAGARTVPLPPQGRIRYPRQTGPSTTFWVGESAPIGASDIGTGDVSMQAKKLAVLIKTSNELIRFASPAAEALMRDDMTKSLALALDLAGLEGTGGDIKPLGIINMPLITTLTSNQTTANGDKLLGQDMYRFPAAVEEANAEFEGYIMRPKTLYKYYQLRADAVAQGDAAGAFLFSMIREAGDGVKAALGGHPVTASTQVSQVRSKGNASNLTYIVGGMWSDLLIGMFGAVEFAATNVGDTAFINDQTWVRGILSADILARHQAAFVFMDSINLSL